MAETQNGGNGFDEHGGEVTAEIWKWTGLAGKVCYLEAGSI